MEIREAATAVWQAFGSGDRDRIAAVLTDDVEWLAPPGNATATALNVTSRMVGPQAIIHFLINDFRRLYPDGMAIEPISVTVEGSRVIFEQRQRARVVNGRKLDLAYVFIFEMADGKVRRIREYMDTATGLRMIFGDETPRQIV